ncbi:MAG: type IV secretion system DNA-binding domain-containing protein [Eubacteriales bacterium]|nr:type IV secretion system DNA-binding domain-containing protein [Eubacteriales bacterium]
MTQSAILKGLQISNDIPYRDPDAFFALAGSDGMGKNAYLPIGQTMLERHLLLLGSGATGKTNMMLHLARNLRVNLGPDDALVLFDPVGEYYQALHQEGDVALADDERAGGEDAHARWNLFCELTDDNRLIEDTSALCDQLFRERIAGAAEPFYPTAARDLTMALIVYLKHLGDPTLLTNQALRELIDGFDAHSMCEILESEPELRTFCGYIGDGASLQAQGVVAALQQAARELFQGGFGEEGTIGVRPLLRSRGGKVIFICYDPSRGSLTRPAFGALCDLALQEALSRLSPNGRLYLLLDNFCTLPMLPHLEDALSMGRAKGVHITLSAIGVETMEARYGAATPSLLSAVGTTVAFQLRDRRSREYVKSLYGRHRVVETYRSTVQMRGIVEQVVDEYIVGDEDLTALHPGDSIIATMHYPPFHFRLKPYSNA